MPANRTYEGTHPWLTFKFNMRDANAKTWMALGEIQSKSEHLAGVPLNPHVATRLHGLYLAKGVMATTAIEGNTLSEDEVEQRIRGALKLPPSKEYLGKEIDNIVTACNAITDRVFVDGDYKLTKKDIKNYNSQVLKNLEVDQGVVPGQFREHRVTVGRYRGAPPEDCSYLIDRLCDWLSGPDFNAPPGYEIVYGVIKAIVSHLYLAWIHPFGDGNGRTARLLEVRFLLEAGAPSPAAHLLSNHYNQTRGDYYRRLDEVSRNGGDIIPFIHYAVDGLCSQLREQIKVVRKFQFDVTWENYVHDQFRDKKTPTDHRRRHIILALSSLEGGCAINAVRRLTPQIAEMYADKTAKTINRDINALIEMELLERRGRIVSARTNSILAFLPVRRTDHLEEPQSSLVQEAA